MRAKTVNFERGENPLTSLGVGILNSTKDINSSEELIDWLIKILPILFKTKDIPEDILGQEGSFINNKYFSTIADYVHEKINYRGPTKHILSKTFFIHWAKNLNIKLRKLGFSKNPN